MVDAKVAGTYTLSYDFTDADGREASTVIRTVIIKDTQEPEITLIGEETIRHRVGNVFIDPGVTAEDALDGSVLVDSSEYTWNQLLVNGYELSGREVAWLNLDFNGGILEQTPKGTAPFINGPLGVGVHIETDALFQALNAGITRNDDFQTLIYGVFRPQVDGDHTFGIDWPDDRGSFWVDLDQDGRFEVEGNHGNEWMNEGSQAGYKTVGLKRGQVYNIAIAHNEGNETTVVSAVTAPGLVRQTLNPAGLEQEGMGRGTYRLQQGGVYTITYTARDAVGNEATTTRTVIVEEPQDPGSFAKGATICAIQWARSS